MIDTLLSVIAPHPCCSCGELGNVLCENCKYDIVYEPFLACIACGSLTMSGVCKNCSMPYTRAWCVGVREESLRRLVGLYKFRNAFAARHDIVDLLDARIDDLPPNTIVVPVPTISRHVRERGYDHMKEIAALFARRRGLQLSLALTRRRTTKQRGAGRMTRNHQAKDAFLVSKPLSSVPYLLLDDVVTTGATMKYASKALIEAGASEVWAGVVCRQPID